MPLLSACAMRLVIVCDFPVPGGPSSTNVRPSAAIATARSCEPSAGIGTGTSASSTGADSRLSSPVTDESRKDSPAWCVKWRTIGLCSSRSQWSERSFHIPKVPNWQIEIVADLVDPQVEFVLDQRGADAA